MADGCNLHLIPKDAHQMEDTRKIGRIEEAKKASRDMASNVLKSRLNNNRDEFLKILYDKNHIQFNLVKELLIKSLSEGVTSRVSNQEENKLPGALYTVLADHHNPPGLFEKAPTARGPGSKKMSHPYELLSTAALIRKEATSSIGKKLRIYPTDKLGFGLKFANDYALTTKGENTFEADTLLYRDPNKVIGIDAKYTKSHSVRVKYGKNSTENELSGIQKGFRDGQLHEFYFVSNVEFHYKFKELVEKYNQEIFKSELKELRKSHKYAFTDAEKSALPPKDKLYIDFNKDREKVNELITKYDIPQIGICEYVNYEES